MSAITRQSLLVCGLGKHVSKYAGVADTGNMTPDDVQKKVQASIAEASALGFDCESFDIDPSDAVGSVDRLKERLNGQKWTGVSIGYGIRGPTQFTKLFEEAVNAVVELAPGAKLMFSVGPDRIPDAIRRTFPDAKVEQGK